jgi:hypothetical protein
MAVASKSFTFVKYMTVPVQHCGERASPVVVKNHGIYALHGYLESSL